MWIGTLALAGVGIPGSASPASTPRTSILEAAFARAHRRRASTPSGCGIAAALLTAFYSWRLLFMTFHGEPRADQHAMEHVHESPLVMLVPLLRAGGRRDRSPAALVLRLLRRRALREHSGASRSSCAPDNHVMRGGARRAGLGEAGCRWSSALLGIARRLRASTCCSPASRRALAARVPRPLYRFLLNKWYFDELYDAIFVRPALRLGRVLWKARRRRGHRRLRPRWRRGRHAATSRAAQARLQTGYVYHYAFVMLIGVVALRHLVLS